jgi:hypothetical protein
MSTRLSRAISHFATATLVVAAIVLAGCSAGAASGTAAGAASGTAAGAASAAPAGPASVVPVATPPGPVPSGRTAAGEGLGTLVPLWPFTTLAQVRTWQAAFQAGGHQPWHLDPAQTALSFARYHLGYADVDRVTSQSVRGGEARIGVGWDDPGASTQTVALLHLARYGGGPDAPWVVVGSFDSRLTLVTPRYGTAVTSPLALGGIITGVDESLRVVVVGPASSVPLASSAGLPAGGESMAWSARLRLRAPAGTVLTIAVSTGGHLKAVEAFAITAVRAA